MKLENVGKVEGRSRKAELSALGRKDGGGCKQRLMNRFW